LGYSTEFTGRFLLNKPLDEETYSFLVKLNETRRMARRLGPEYGVEGELYVDGGGEFGQDQESSIIDYNRPPSTQPCLWCQWRPTEDHKGIEWDGGEKFYCYREWLKYITDNFLTPKGYTLSGVVEYQGEDSDDHGWIDGSRPLDILLTEPSQTVQTDPVAGTPLPEPRAPGRKIIWEKET